jgi:hypothetical protein
MKLIAKQTLGSTTATVTFSDIPQTYTDLLVVVSARGNASAITSFLIMTIAGSGTTSSPRYLQGNGSTAGSGANVGGFMGYIPAATSTASTFGNTELYIPNYTGSTAKSVSTSTVTENNATTAQIGVHAAIFGTAAATSLAFTANDSNFVSGSSFFLYGITKA